MNLEWKQLLLPLIVLEIALALTYAVVWSYKGGSVLKVSFACLLAWTGYLLAHRVETGSIVDSSEGKGTLSDIHDAGALTGLMFMVFAFPTGILAVNQDFVPLLFIAETMFLGGYMVSHRRVTGDYF